MQTVSVIIPVRPGSFPGEAVQCLLRSDYPLEKLEVIVAEGVQPSRQRNRAAEAANGEILYFLDDDSFTAPGAIKAGVAALSKSNASTAGGPAVTRIGAGFWERCFGEVVGSLFGTFITRARNVPLGGLRVVRGEELVLCNLMMRRDVFLELRGLDVNLYPNEENEMLKRLRKSGYRSCYTPEMLVFRSRRPNLAAFVEQIFRYGWGRGRHIFLHFDPWEIVFTFPLLFMVYVLTLTFWQPSWYFLPLACYLLLALCAGLGITARSRSAATGACSVFLFALMHAAYGCGLIAGLWSRQSKNKAAAPVRISKLHPARCTDEQKSYAAAG